MESIYEIINGVKNIYIYGAGCWGNLFFQYCRKRDRDISGYIVTSKGKQDITNNMPVYLFSEFELNSDDIIVVCLYYPQTVEKTLIDAGVTNYYCLKQEELIEMSKSMWKIVMDNASEKDELISIKDKKYLNPLYMNDIGYWESFTDSIDIIFPSDLEIYEYINEGPYEYGKVYLKKDYTVLDLGACIGIFSEFALNKGCTVYGLEPSPYSYKYLLNMKKVLQEYTNFSIYNLGVSNETGKHEFYTGGKSLGFDGFRGLPDLCEKIQVDVVTVDDFVVREKIEQVDFIKANIEGAERLMLDGAIDTIRKFHPKLSLRTNHYPDDPEVLEAKIKKIDSRYNVVHKWKQLYAWVD